MTDEQFNDGDDAPDTTGDATVDAALDRLRDLPETPTEEHPRVYEDVHRDLSAALTDPDAD